MNKNEKKIKKKPFKNPYEASHRLKDEKGLKPQAPSLENKKPLASCRSLKEKQANKEAKVFVSSNKKALELDQKLKQALEDNLYLRASFENFKRRSDEEKQKLIKYGGEKLILSLANEVLDDLERAMSFAKEKESFENLKTGLNMIQKKLFQVLSHFGVQILDPTGKAFDPSYQEALSHIKTSKIPEGHVAETFKKAYRLHDKVIRPAQVILAKKEEQN